MIITCPLFVMVGRKRVALNLGVYRNLHHQVNAKAKINFKQEVFNQVARLPKMGVIDIEYTLFVKDKRRMDVANVCSIVDKYFSDVLVMAGKIDDDDYDHVRKVSYAFGGIDRGNPRVEAKIKVSLADAENELCEFNNDAEELAFELAYMRYRVANLERFIKNGVDIGYIVVPDKPDHARDTIDEILSA